MKTLVLLRWCAHMTDTPFAQEHASEERFGLHERSTSAQVRVQCVLLHSDSEIIHDDSRNACATSFTEVTSP